MYLGDCLGIGINDPVKDHENGFWWIASFFIGLLVFMIGGYLLGWLLNAVMLKVFFKWPANKIKDFLLYSQVPESWLKDTSENQEEVNVQWETTRQIGMKRFILKKGILTWGLTMYVIMSIVPAFTGRVVPTVSYFVIQGLIWAIAGGLFGWVVWYLSERSYKKRLK